MADPGRSQEKGRDPGLADDGHVGCAARRAESALPRSGSRSAPARVRTASAGTAAASAYRLGGDPATESTNGDSARCIGALERASLLTRRCAYASVIAVVGTHLAAKDPI